MNQKSNIIFAILFVLIGILFFQVHSLKSMISSGTGSQAGEPKSDYSYRPNVSDEAILNLQTTDLKLRFLPTTYCARGGDKIKMEEAPIIRFDEANGLVIQRLISEDVKNPNSFETVASGEFNIIGLSVFSGLTSGYRGETKILTNVLYFRPSGVITHFRYDYVDYSYWACAWHSDNDVID